MESELHKKYGTKTLVSGWNYGQEGFPKDYDPQTAEVFNLFHSSYKRLGTGDPTAERLTEQRRAQLQMMSAKLPPLSAKPIINTVSFPTTLGPVRRSYWPEAGVVLPPRTMGRTDYLTTMQKDYVNYYPTQPKIIPRAELYKPVTQFRRLQVDGTDPRRPGINTFYDDNLDYLNKRGKERGVPPFSLHYQPTVI